MAEHECEKRGLRSGEGQGQGCGSSAVYGARGRRRASGTPAGGEPPQRSGLQSEPAPPPCVPKEAPVHSGSQLADPYRMHQKRTAGKMYLPSQS